VTVTNQLYSL